MPQPVEAQAFLARITQVPSGPGAIDALLQALRPSLENEAELRKLFAIDKNNSRLQDPHVGLVDVFDAPSAIRTTRARIIANEEDLAARYVLPLSDKQRRKDGEPAMVSSLDEFKQNWTIFSEGSLSQLADWSNVVAAGGSVQACLQPVPDSAKASKRAMRKYFHNSAFPTSDVDLFLYGLTPEQAEAKMQTIYEAVRDSVPWDVTCVRTKHTVSIHSQYPYRSVQIVLRLYSSPAEILAGFDVDAPCCLFDGERVWANPRAIVAMMRQCNTVDMTRRSPSYEVRLTKYSARGFEVHVPDLCRAGIDPTIFERSIVFVKGLARLLVLERLKDADAKDMYLRERRKLRARPDSTTYWAGRYRKKAKGDLKANVDVGRLEMNDYDVQALHIPYGPGWDARRIDKLVYQTDLSMNSPYNPKNKDRRLHRHPAYFGTMAECLEDCCEYCPEPKDDDEKKLQEAEDDSHVRGRVQFIQEDPGRQSISGSFNPINEGEWAEQAYMGLTEKLFAAIVAGDRAAVARVLAEEGADVDRRDHVGRTPLQVAILSRVVDVACDLIDAGARMTSRLVDGRTALHLAAQLDLPAVVRKLLERSASNAEKAKEEEARQAKKADDVSHIGDGDSDADEGDDVERNSSEDDWDSEDDARKKNKNTKEQKPDASQIPEEEQDMPDVFDVNLPDWDYAFTPLQYAVAFGSTSSVEELLTAGADPKLVTQTDGYMTKPLHPLTLTALTRDVEVACEIAKKLFSSGAVSSEADSSLFTIFHKIVCTGKATLVDAFLQHDLNAKAVLDTPYVTTNARLTFPVVSAIARGSYATLAVLLSYGAKYVFTEEDWSRARDLKDNAYPMALSPWRSLVYPPVEAGLASLEDSVDLLLQIGAEYDVGMIRALRENVGIHYHKSILDCVRGIIPALQQDADRLATYTDDELGHTKYHELAVSSGWKADRGKQLLKLSEQLPRFRTRAEINAEMREKFCYALEYFKRTEELLVAHHAKSWKDLFPDSGFIQDPSTCFGSILYSYHDRNSPTRYHKMVGKWGWNEVPSHAVGLYDELFEACNKGDKPKIEALCLPKSGKGKIDKLVQVACRFGNEWGLTPLSLALSNRHWDAARLILAIAVAQYKPKDEKPTRFTVSTNLALDEDSDEDSEDSTCNEEDVYDREEVRFIDIAHRPSQVETDVPPSRLLELTDGYLDRTEAAINGLSILKTIIDDDFEGFVQIADLYKILPEPVELPALEMLEWVSTYDRPEMLDELIRRTGAGIVVPDANEDEDEIAEGKPKTLPPKTYFGLNVHGKKRKDLARKADPNAHSPVKQFEIPLLWAAARSGAVRIVRYLATERPVAAYDYYASTHSDEKAQYLRRIRDQIPQRIGWTVNALNESVITASVVGDHVDVLEAVIAIQPAQMQNALMSRVHYVGFNNILVAANWGCSPGMFDYLLSKGIMPAESDVRGWNILHILCANDSDDHVELLKHVIKKLPEEVTACLLVQQSKVSLNTPLHIAAKRDRLATIKVLLEIKAPMFTLRDRSGSTPLHLAIKAKVPHIVRIVGSAGPAEALHMEDGVGNTPLEIATQLWLQDRISSGFSTTLPDIQTFNLDNHPYGYWNPHKASHEDVELLKKTISNLLAGGRLRHGTMLATALTTFATGLEEKVKQRDQRGEVAGQNDESESEDAVGEMLAYITGAIAENPGHRRLVHLIDVHRSVKGSLESAAHHAGFSAGQVPDDGGLEREHAADDTDDKVKKLSVLSEWHMHYVMPLFGPDPF
ncbi:ankyrin [Trametes meyenii]|nr:ankyrin [Trametes meyenii]